MSVPEPRPYGPQNQWPPAPDAMGVYRSHLEQVAWGERKRYGRVAFQAHGGVLLLLIPLVIIWVALLFPSGLFILLALAIITWWIIGLMRLGPARRRMEQATSELLKLQASRGA